MSRLKLQLPEKLLTSVSIPVRITDINYGNHVGNDAIVQFIHEARAQFLALHGYTELKVAETALIMSNLIIEFKKESFYGDQLVVKLYAGNLSRVSFDFFYSIHNMRNNEDVLIAKAQTTMVTYDYNAGKVMNITSGLQKILLL